MKLFYEECEKNKDFPIILLLDNNTFANRKKYPMPWNHITADLKEIGFFVAEAWNKIPEVYNNGLFSIINSDRIHYTPMANKIFAEHIHQNLKNYFNLNR